MRKLMTAVVAVAAAGMVMTGCERKSEVQRQQEDVAEARVDVAKAQQERNQEIAEARQDAQEDVIDAQKDLADEQRDLAEAQYKQNEDLRDDNLSATGGSGMVSAKTEEVKGIVKSASDNSVTLMIKNKDNQLMTFQSNNQLKVMHDDKPLALSNLKAGDEVRASYQRDATGTTRRRPIDVTKPSAQHHDSMVK